MIKKVLNIRQEVVYQNPELGESYRRVVGGLAWPALPEPGYLVVVAENWAKDDGLEARKLRVLVERGFNTIVEMHRTCQELRKSCKVGMWLTDMQRNQEVRLFLRQNRDLNLIEDVYLAEAPYAREAVSLGTYAQLIMELVQPGRKILQFGAESQLSGHLITRTPEEMNKSAHRFPSLAALGYAVAEIVIRQPVDPRVLIPKPITTWNRHQWARMEA